MPKPDSDNIVPAETMPAEPARPIEKQTRHDEPMDEEEKILAGRADANIPALLTKDVPGG